MSWFWIVAGVVVAGVAAVLGVAYVRYRRRQNGLLSIVMLSNGPRELTEAMVRGAARRAMGKDVEVEGLPIKDEHGISGLVVKSAVQGMYFVISAHRPYVDDPVADSLRYENEQVRQKFAAHRAWIAVDAAGVPPGMGETDNVTRCIARLAAELIDDSCTMLYTPATERVALAGPDTEAALRSDDPFSIFADDVVNTPIIHVANGTAGIDRAMEEARRRWPEFVAAFARVGEGGNGLVKGKFSEDEQAEYMWIKATAATAQSATGELVNSPAIVKSVKKGQIVTIQFAQIADWVWYEDGEQKGMFVERLLRN